MPRRKRYSLEYEERLAEDREELAREAVEAPLTEAEGRAIDEANSNFPLDWPER